MADNKHNYRDDQVSLQSEEITRPRPNDDSNQEDSELLEQGA